MKKLRLHVDPLACDGAGYCAEIAPELIEADDWGFPIIKRVPMSEDDLDVAKKAIRICPRQALTLQTTEDD